MDRTSKTMPFKLQVQENYPPINESAIFPTELPSLTVITGLNGNGKTRLLKAIASGRVSVEVDGEQVPTSNIDFQDSVTLSLDKEIRTTSKYIEERNVIWGVLKTAQLDHFNKFVKTRTVQLFPRNTDDPNSLNINFISKYIDELKSEIQELLVEQADSGQQESVSEDILTDKQIEGGDQINEVDQVGEDELTQDIKLEEKDPTKIESTLKDLDQLLISLKTSDKIIIQGASNQVNAITKTAGAPAKLSEPQAKVYKYNKDLVSVGLSVNYILEAIEKSCETPLLILSRAEFDDFYPTNVETRPFARSFSRWLTEYMERLAYNANLQRDMDTHGKSVKAPLSDAEFIEHNGPSPWDIIDEVLAEAGIDYKISRPSFNTDEQFFATLENSLDEQVQLSEISSGEKIILSLISSLLYAAKSNQSKSLPKVLLLDEIDASLHPSLTNYLLKALKSFVEKYAISIILSSHSPSTVALADKESIHILRKSEGGIKLLKTDQDIALNILTEGIPTLSVKRELRRPVFVENISDVEIYESIYQRHCLHNDRADGSPHLSFIAAAGSHRGGCTVVREQVKALRGVSNTTIFGIVDWDTKNESDEHVLVPGKAECRRFSIENYVLDPVATIMYLLKESKRVPEDFKLGKTISYTDIPNLDTNILNGVVEEFVLQLKLSCQNKISVRYYRLPELLVPQSYLVHQGHELETLVRDTFDIRRDNLCKAVTREIHCHSVDVIPIEFFELFSKLEDSR